MDYFSISFSKKKNIFVSLEGDEPNVNILFDERFSYYLHKSDKFIVKLINILVDSDSAIGEIVSLDGNVIQVILHPGKKHGVLCVGGLVSGDSKSFKFILSPRGSGRQYFLRYHIQTNTFEEAGVDVR